MTDDELKIKMDEVADEFVLLIHSRLADTEEARAAFEHWREAFAAHGRNPEMQWIRDTVESAYEELRPHWINPRIISYNDLCKSG